MSVKPESTNELRHDIHQPVVEASRSATPSLINGRPAEKVAAVRSGRMNLDDALSRYKLTVSEVLNWKRQMWPTRQQVCEPDAGDAHAVEILSEDDNVLIGARIREQSETGAFLLMAASKRLPHQVVIRQSVDQSCKTATVKWMNGNSAVVEYV
ncbi:MAG TPA: DUF1153 domain-containing protein [Afifellaceae bacterium]|nr:DUF1153 domain-containing protein [Afifellaceae bacterium]